MLCYAVRGFVYDVGSMTPQDRQDFLTLLAEQKDREARVHGA